MDHTALLLLAIGTLMIIAIIVQIISKRFNLPYTVLLVIAGLLIVPLTKIPAFEYISLFKLTPELLFYIFLPILLFEAAYNMRLTKVLKDVKIISLMAVVGLLISTISVAVIFSFLLGLFGYDIPFLILLLFGALISATDPVAVLALFKEFGVPGRLALIFEGESLFNDATSVAMFLVILDIVRVGTFGSEELLEGVFMFFTMMVGGGVAGILLGLFFSKMLQFVDGDPKSQITITMLVAHVTFISTEFFHLIPFGETHIHLSPIVATVIAAMIVGNYGRYKIRKNVEEYMDKFWDYFAFVSNSLVFLLLGLLFASIDASLSEIIIPIVTGIVAVALARIVAVYSTVIPYNLVSKATQNIPKAWAYLLSWGSLRGALAIIMVLLIPDDLTIANWPMDMSIKDFILVITISCIYFTLFVKATTIPAIISKFKLDKLTELDEARYLEGKAYYHAITVMEVDKALSKKTLGANKWSEIREEAKKNYNESVKKLREIIEDTNIKIVADTILHRYAIGIERRALEKLYISGEISEYVYKKANNKLYSQEDCIEEGNGNSVSFSSLKPVDAVDSIISFLRKIFLLKEYEITDYDKLMYYRALAHIAQAVIEELDDFANSLYADKSVEEKEIKNLKEIYKKYKEQSVNKMRNLIENNESLMDKYNNLLVKKVKYLQKKAIDKMQHNEMLNQRTYIKIINETRK